MRSFSQHVEPNFIDSGNTMSLVRLTLFKIQALNRPEQHRVSLLSLFHAFSCLGPLLTSPSTLTHEFLDAALS